MSDKAIILSVILAAVLCVAVPFIFRVCRYRRRMKTLIVPDGPSGRSPWDCPHPEAEYLARYICLLRLPFAGNKHVKIRPSYHGRHALLGGYAGQRGGDFPPRNRSTRSSSPQSVSSRRKPTINPRPALSASSCATA